ncbi:MAG: hypothetical protein KDA22_10985, partial [Phycisphaerales bacterium]|nr:hypothetical protein [Phycisphaerales bacterium]
MFLRRLGFLYALSAAVVVVMVLQLSRLTLAEGADHLADAESRLDQRTFLATYRGRILDRKGRVLAADRPSYDIAVEYEVLTGAWAAHEAAVAARKEVGRTAWSEMDPSARGRAIERHLPAFDAQVERLYATICDRGGIDRDELERRIDEIKRRVHTRAVAVWDRQREMESNR